MSEGVGQSPKELHWPTEMVICAEDHEEWPCAVSTGTVRPGDDLLLRLVTLVRMGFLVTVGGERAKAEDVQGNVRPLLLSVLEAPDSETGARRLLENS